MSETDLALISRLLEDLWKQMDHREYLFHGPPPGAVAFWTAAYNRYLAALRPRFSDDPLLAQFEEIPEGQDMGYVQMAVGQLCQYVAHHLFRDPSASARESGHSLRASYVDEFGHRVDEIARTLRAVSGEGAGEKTEALLAELRVRLEHLESRLAHDLGEDED
jgi:hypothetical protein